jgi:predicted nucleic acid-binding protein
VRGDSGELSAGDRSTEVRETGVPTIRQNVPKEYQFSIDELFIRKEGDDVILFPRPRDWSAYLESAPTASDTFMSEVEIYRFRSASADAALHAGHRHVLLHHEAVAPTGHQAPAVGGGWRRGANDLFIAAHARSHGLTLVTNDTSEFERVRSLEVENWTLPPRRRR